MCVYEFTPLFKFLLKTNIFSFFRFDFIRPTIGSSKLTSSDQPKAKQDTQNKRKNSKSNEFTSLFIYFSSFWSMWRIHETRNGIEKRKVTERKVLMWWWWQSGWCREIEKIPESQWKLMFMYVFVACKGALSVCVCGVRDCVRCEWLCVC